MDDHHVIGEQVVQGRDRAPRVEPVHRGDVRIGHQLGGDGTEAVIGRDEQHPDPLGLLGGQRLRRRRCGQVRAHDQARMAESSVGRLRRHRLELGRGGDAGQQHQADGQHNETIAHIASRMGYGFWRDYTTGRFMGEWVNW